jgi:hypothetical protein
VNRKSAQKMIVVYETLPYHREKLKKIEQAFGKILPQYCVDKFLCIGEMCQ